MQGVQELLMGTADVAPSMAAFTAAMEANSAFVVSCEGQVGLHMPPQAHVVPSLFALSCAIPGVLPSFSSTPHPALTPSAVLI